ncbi:MAG: class I SAM-dependent methyltransferase [Balneolales bacterium]|nr:class I SAM-dependent methyltransferase [Balneolales bacterium]
MPIKSEQKHPTCPLCTYTGPAEIIDGQDSRTYFMCPKCRLVHVEPTDYLPPEIEKERYLTHNNGIQYPGYVKFLNRAIEPTLPFLNDGAHGLDFGCGPAPTLSILMQQNGFSCEDYDPFFFPELPSGPFDYIFATECFEHFFNPAKEIGQINQRLKPGGLLTIMTLFWHTQQDFQTNFYFRDTAHTVFYHPETIKWIATNYGFKIELIDMERIAILRKKG